MAKILEDDIIDLRHDDFIDDEPKITRKVSIDTSSEKPKVSVTSNAPSKTQQKQGKPAEHIVIKIPKIPVKYVERGFYWIVIIILLFLLFKQPVTDFFSSSKIVLEEEIANAEENLENEPAAPSSNTTVPTPPKTETKTVPKTTTISTAKCSGGITLNLQDSGIRSEAILGRDDAKKISAVTFIINNQESEVFHPDAKLYIYDASTKSDFKDFVRGNYQLDLGIPACTEKTVTIEKISPKIFANLDEDKTVLIKLYNDDTDIFVTSDQVDVDLS